MSHYPSPNEKTWQCFQMFLWVEAVHYEKKCRSPMTEAGGKAQSARELTGSVRPVQVVLCWASWSYSLRFCSADRRNINNLRLLVWVTVCWSLSVEGLWNTHFARSQAPSLGPVTISCSYQFDRLNNLEVIMCFRRVLSWGLGWANGKPGRTRTCSSMFSGSLEWRELRKETNGDRGARSRPRSSHAEL